MKASVAVPRLYLASASPRRRELLLQLGLQHEVLPQHLDESVLPGEAAPAYVQRVAREKAQVALLDARRRADLPVLAADTAVVCDGLILGKPQSQQDALDMLGRLSGREHQVLTAVAIAQGERLYQALSQSRVWFRPLAQDELLAYWHSGEPCDKAGSYAVQGLGAMFIARIDGSYSGVMGLPLYETMQLLANFGITPVTVLDAFHQESST